MANSVTTSQYLENPVLFINSTSAAVPKGRNVRAQARTQQAHILAPPREQNNGQFGVFDLNPKRATGTDNTVSRKRRKPSGGLKITDGSVEISRAREIASASSLSNLSHRLRECEEVHIDPRNILPLATFHVRRIAAMTVRTDPSRLPEVLRCRQWSCVPSDMMTLGRSRCLDSALACVAAKLRQMTGEATSTLHVLSSYSDALRELQAALQSPSKYDFRDLLSTTQLLAVFEMLDSLETATWNKHIAGASSLVQPENGRRSLSGFPASLTFAQVAPMFTDALLSCNEEVLNNDTWRSFFQLILNEPSRAGSFEKLISYLLDLLKLLKDAKELSGCPESTTLKRTYELLDRAHILKAELRKEVLESDPTSGHGNKALGSFDRLGMGLAALIAVDHLITSVRPVEFCTPWTAKDDTNELCAQLLQLELGAADGAYPATDLMSAFRRSTFQEQAGYIIVFPGCGDD